MQIDQFKDHRLNYSIVSREAISDNRLFFCEWAIAQTGNDLYLIEQVLQLTAPYTAKGSAICYIHYTQTNAHRNSHSLQEAVSHLFGKATVTQKSPSHPRTEAVQGFFQSPFSLLMSEKPLKAKNPVPT